VLAGCPLRNTSDPPRFFQPGSTMLDDTGDDQPDAGGGGVPIRLRAVHGMPLLRERIVWRLSPVEYGLYEQRRWSDLPASYVERALATALWRTPGLRLTDDSRVPTLRVEVVAFDEVLAPAPAASVALVVSLRDGERRRLLDREFAAQAPATDDDPAAMARAMGRALDDVVAQVAAAVAAAVRAAS